MIGRLGARTFAFIGLERVGGIMVYDVSNPTSPFFVTYENSRLGATGVRVPEGLTFISAVRSPNKRPLLIVGNKTSGSVAIYEIVLQERGRAGVKSARSGALLPGRFWLRSESKPAG